LVQAHYSNLLNVALFGNTAAQWRDKNPANKGNIRDIATLEQLVILSIENNKIASHLTRVNYKFIFTLTP
jgi:hypothetical protein